MFTRLIDRWIKPAGDTAMLDLVLRLTLIEILLRPMGFWAIRASLLLVALLGLLIPKVLRAPLTWLVLSVLVGWRLIDDWPLADNHIYLLAYWCLALAIALGTQQLEKNIHTSSRILLGLAFAFAVLWKGFLSPDYLDGRFFRITFLIDDRFAHAVMLFGNLDEQQLLENREYLKALPQGAELLNPPVLTEPPAFSRLVRFSTWATLLMEAAVAFTMLIPLRGRWQNLRHIFLLSFCIGTYAFAPVAGFGWLLLVMGMAQCRIDQRTWRALYLATYLLVLLYTEVPWSRLLFERLGG